MPSSDGRIPTTHVGSLIRPPELLKFIAARQSGQAYDESEYQSCLARSVAEVVQRQAKAGIDLPSDGEFGKSISWSQYALERLSGFVALPLLSLIGVARRQSVSSRRRSHALR